jgi:hypothetical protein
LGKQFEQPKSMYKIRHAGHYFLMDHIDRMGEETGLGHQHVGEGDKTHLHVNMTDNQASSLLDDARFYSEGGDWDPAVRDLQRSAKSVKTSLEKHFK